MINGHWCDVPIDILQETEPTLYLIVRLLDEIGYRRRPTSVKPKLVAGEYACHEFLVDDDVHNSLGAEVSFTTKERNYHIWYAEEQWCERTKRAVSIPPRLVMSPNGKSTSTRIHIDLTKPDGEFSLSWLEDLIRRGKD